MLRNVTRRLARWVGIGSCTIAAAFLSVAFSHTSLKTLLPFLFLAVIIVVAIRFGHVAGIVGTITAALVFAIFLFQPTLSPIVEDAEARDHLIWMLLIGVILSDLLGAYTIAGTKNKHL